MAVKDIREVPPIIKSRSADLWLNLIDSHGEPVTVRHLLDEEAMDDANQFARVMGTTTTLFFTQTWPRVIAIVEALGVPRDELVGILHLHMRDQLEKHLRSDVSEAEAVA